MLKVIRVGPICPVISFCIHQCKHQTLWNVSQEEIVWCKATESTWYGENFTIHSANGMGYLAGVCFRATACPRITEEATLTFRMYRIASVITTLKLAPGTDETKQKEFLALLSFSLRLTPFKIKRSWKKNIAMDWPHHIHCLTFICKCITSF